MLQFLTGLSRAEKVDWCQALVLGKNSLPQVLMQLRKLPWDAAHERYVIKCLLKVGLTLRVEPRFNALRIISWT